MHGEILGVERRRRWRDEDKLGIVQSIGVDGATVTQIAQRHDVTRQQIYTWRHTLRKKGLLPPAESAMFVPVEFSSGSGVTEAVGLIGGGCTSVELLLCNGRRLRFDSRLEASTLTRLIRSIEAA